MKTILQRFFYSARSLLTAFLIMASPVAAIIYASEPMTATQSHDPGYIAAAYETPLVDHLDQIARKVDNWMVDFPDNPLTIVLAQAK